jgi:hypothetical protein
MPNHYHLLVYLRIDALGAQIMQPLTVSYAKAVNKQQGRSGPLFAGPFRAKHLDRDEYLSHLTRYIHMNPVEAGLALRPEEWEYSSYRDYIGLRHGTLPKPDEVMARFPSLEAYRDFVLAYSYRAVGVPDHLLFG